MNKDLFAIFMAPLQTQHMRLDVPPRLVWQNPTGRYRAILSYQGDRGLSFYGMAIFTVERCTIDALGQPGWSPLREDPWVLHDLVGQLLQTITELPDPDDE